METLSLTQVLGLFGFIGYMAGFASQQFGLIDGNSKTYSLINVGSASLVLLSLMEHFNLASALIQISWIAIGLGGLTIRIVRSKIVRSKSERQAMVNSVR